jgi:Mg-chelatase subunit ChlD
MTTTATQQLAYILDRSGSMQGMEEAAITAFNSFLHTQQQLPGHAALTLVLFDDQYEVHLAAKPLADVPQLTASTFMPRGRTALRDAIGRSIKDLDSRVLPDSPCPIVAIFTDGQENSSHLYSVAHLNDLIAERRQRGWQFLFLAANQDAFATGQSYGIASDSISNVEYSFSGLKSSGQGINRKAAAMRLHSFGEALSVAEQADLTAPLSEIVADEASKSDPSVNT